MSSCPAIFDSQPKCECIDTANFFTFSQEGNFLRVRNGDINCLFRGLDFESFNTAFNDFRNHLRLNLDGITLNNKHYALSQHEKEYLEQKIITDQIYLRTQRGAPLIFTPIDFESSFILDAVLHLLDSRHGVDSEIALALGSSIMRTPMSKYMEMVKARRMYYDR